MKIEGLVRGYHLALDEGRFADAADTRESARTLLSRTSPSDEQFVSWTGEVSELYAGGSMGVQRRAVIEQSLARTAAIPAAHPIRIDLLCLLAQAWEADRNLLRSLSYLEQAAAAIV